MNRLTPETIATLERVGLVTVLEQVAALCDDHGQDKHGDRGWESLTDAQIMGKALGHLGKHMAGAFIDPTSGRMHLFHFMGRALQLGEKWARLKG